MLSYGDSAAVDMYRTVKREIKYLKNIHIPLKRQKKSFNHWRFHNCFCNYGKSSQDGYKISWNSQMGLDLQEIAHSTSNSKVVKALPEVKKHSELDQFLHRSRVEPPVQQWIVRPMKDGSVVKKTGEHLWIAEYRYQPLSMNPKWPGTVCVGG